MWEIDYVSGLKSLKNKVYNFLEYDYNVLLTLSLRIGKVLFIGGWTIFAFWIIGRYTFAIELRVILFLGFLWAYLGIFIGIFGLILLIIYTIIRINNLRWLVLTTLLLHILNIVSAFAIFAIHSVILNKVFIKFENNSKLNDIGIIIIRENEIEIFIYKPKTIISDARTYLEPEVIKLEIIANQKKELIDFPLRPLGTCCELKLNEIFELKKERRIFWNF